MRESRLFRGLSDLRDGYQPYGFPGSLAFGFGGWEDETTGTGWFMGRS